MRFAFYLMALVIAGVLSAAEPSYSCSMRLGNPKFEGQVLEPGQKNSRSRNARRRVETLHRKMICPVAVSFRSKEIPTGIKLQYVFLGQRDGSTVILDARTLPVTLDERGNFTTELISPVATLSKTKFRNRRSSWSETTGSRVSGCIVQLYVGEKMVRYGATKPAWANVAKKAPMPDGELLKLR